MISESGIEPMGVPKDQNLTITIFLSISLFGILLAWIFLPPTVSFEENEMNIRVLPPEEAVLTAEEILLQAEQSLNELEEKEEKEKEGDGQKAEKAK